MNERKMRDLIIILLVIFIPLGFSYYIANQDVNTETKKNDLNILLNQANSSYNVNNFDKAIIDSNKALSNISSAEISKFPDQYVEAQKIIGDSYYHLSLYKNSSEENLNKSLAAYEKILTFYNNDISQTEDALKNSHISDAYRDSGIKYKNQGNYDEAIKSFDKAIETNPQDSGAWIDKGVFLFSRGNYDEAMKCFDKAIEIYPNNAEAWNDKGYAFKEMGEYEQAIKAFNEAIMLDPIFTDAWEGKGYSLEQLGRKEEAQKCFQKAEELRKADGNSLA